ncbi:hypothetical protein BpHYR1_014564 [Brachionus plicatilis]|uniref:Uncharacterized protein n=1 Tax=Brachionus plicatilis TaxID=10195 RepID=A0A3M7PTJ2_BRAPC|nr:hypothetical protein BpHYR1_014564 [Brachionus plicatilis]
MSQIYNFLSFAESVYWWYKGCIIRFHFKTALSTSTCFSLRSRKNAFKHLNDIKRINRLTLFYTLEHQKT